MDSAPEPPGLLPEVEEGHQHLAQPGPSNQRDDAARQQDVQPITSHQGVDNRQLQPEQSIQQEVEGDAVSLQPASPSMPLLEEAAPPSPQSLPSAHSGDGSLDAEQQAVVPSTSSDDTNVDVEAPLIENPLEFDDWPPFGALPPGLNGSPIQLPAEGDLPVEEEPQELADLILGVEEPQEDQPPQDLEDFLLQEEQQPPDMIAFPFDNGSIPDDVNYVVPPVSPSRSSSNEAPPSVAPSFLSVEATTASDSRTLSEPTASSSDQQEHQRSALDCDAGEQLVQTSRAPHISGRSEGCSSSSDRGIPSGGLHEAEGASGLREGGQTSSFQERAQAGRGNRPTEAGQVGPPPQETAVSQQQQQQQLLPATASTSTQEQQQQQQQQQKARASSSTQGDQRPSVPHRSSAERRKRALTVEIYPSLVAKGRTRQSVRTWLMGVDPTLETSLSPKNTLAEGGSTSVVAQQQREGDGAGRAPPESTAASSVATASDEQSSQDQLAETQSSQDAGEVGLMQEVSASQVEAEGEPTLPVAGVQESVREDPSSDRSEADQGPEGSELAKGGDAKGEGAAVTVSSGAHGELSQAGTSREAGVPEAREELQGELKQREAGERQLRRRRKGGQETRYKASPQKRGRK